MVNKPALSRGKSDGKAAPMVDGTLVRNELLLSLPPEDWESIFSELTSVQLRTHEVLHESGEPIRFAYFLNSGLASVLSVLSEGKSVEVGLTGKEGFVGLPLVVGLRTSPTRTVIQIEGAGFRVSPAGLMKILRRSETLEQRLQRYVQVLSMQASQVAACNRIHEVDERLARWLLMCQDRISSDTVPLTQELLAHMLGTRRSSVTVAAGTLQKAGLITYKRGNVKIESRENLKDAACECYEAMQRQSRNWLNESNNSVR
jgi:CRP-like cAMP-binding protein